MILAFYNALPVDPETFWAILFLSTAIITAAVGITREALAAVRIETALALAEQAADHNEPTRAEVEAPWLTDHSHIEATPLARRPEVAS